MKQLIFTSTLW